MSHMNNKTPYEQIRNKMRQQITANQNKPIPQVRPAQMVTSNLHLIGATISLKCKFCNEEFQSVDKDSNNALIELINNVNTHISLYHPSKIPEIQQKLAMFMGTLGTIASLGHLTYFSSSQVEGKIYTETEDNLIEQLDKYIVQLQDFIEQFYLANNLDTEEEEEEDKGDEEKEDEYFDDLDRLAAFREKSNIPTEFLDPNTKKNIVSSPRYPLVESVAPQDNLPTCSIPTLASKPTI